MPMSPPWISAGLMVAYVIERLDMTGDDRLMAEDSAKLDTISGIQKGLMNPCVRVCQNKLLRDI